jgi:hypothetical protein
MGSTTITFLQSDSVSISKRRKHGGGEGDEAETIVTERYADSKLRTLLDISAGLEAIAGPMECFRTIAKTSFEEGWRTMQDN